MGLISGTLWNRTINWYMCFTRAQGPSRIERTSSVVDRQVWDTQTTNLNSIIDSTEGLLDTSTELRTAIFIALCAYRSLLRPSIIIISPRGWLYLYGMVGMG